MKRSDDTLRFLLQTLSGINGKEKTAALLQSFIADPVMVETLLAIESLLPKFEIRLDEVVTEGKRATIQGRLLGRTGLGMKSNFLEIPFALGCRVVQGKIADYWLIVDQLALP